MRSRFARKMSYHATDVLKIAALIAIFSFLTYNALTTYLFIPQKAAHVHINPDYGPCNAISQCATCVDKDFLIQSCRAELKAVFKQAETKCSGYIKNLEKCRGKGGQCRIEAQNTEGCISLVVAKAEAKWAAIARGEQPVA
jgi:hypothetical protein